MKFLIVLIAITCILNGCANHPSRYNPENASLLDLAFVVMEKIPFMKIWYKASVVSVMDEEGNEVITTGFSTSKHFNVAVIQGNYFVVLRCDNTYIYAFPTVPVTLQKGKKYTAYCRRKVVEGESAGIVGFILESSESAPPRLTI